MVLVQKEDGGPGNGAKRRALVRRHTPVFRSPRSLLVLFAVCCVAALIVFGRTPSDDAGRAVDNRGFLAACEASPFASGRDSAGGGSDVAEAARLCSCVLAWHVREGERTGYPLPAALYRSNPTAAASGEVSSLARSVDAKARAACRSGRVPQ